MRMNGLGVLLASAAASVIASAAMAQDMQAAPAAGAATDEQERGEIVVLGSRIPRVQQEGPAPVTTMARTDGSASSFWSVAA